MDKIREYFERTKQFYHSLNTKSKILVGILSFVILRKGLRGIQSGKSLESEIVFITGAGSGIGRNLALKLSSLGAKVAIADIDISAAQEVEATILKDQRVAIALFCDVTDPNSVREAADKVRNNIGSPSILVNNAGILIGKNFLDSSLEENEKTMKVNCIAHFITVREFLPDMIAHKKGHLVTIASSGGFYGTRGLTDYCSSKFGALGFDEALRNELKLEHNYIKTTCVCPFYVNTNLVEGISLRFKFLFPLLEPEWVAKRIIRGIRMEEEMVVMPYTVKSWLYFKYILPPSFGDLVGRCFGFHNAMETFVGRDK